MTHERRFTPDPRPEVGGSGCEVTHIVARSRESIQRGNAVYTSAKSIATDPVNGAQVEVMWTTAQRVHRSDTVTEYAALRLDRLHQLSRNIAVAASTPEELSTALGYCLFAPAPNPLMPAAAVQAIIEATHVDIYLACPAMTVAVADDGQALTERMFGDLIGWIPFHTWGFDLGRDVQRARELQSRARGCIVEACCVIVWGDTDREAAEAARWVNKAVTDYFAVPRSPTEPRNAASGTSSISQRDDYAAALAPRIRNVLSAGATNSGRLVGHFDDSARAMNFVDHDDLYLRTVEGQDDYLDSSLLPLVIAPGLARSATLQQVAIQVGALARPRVRSPAVIGVPGVGLFTYGTTKRQAQLLSEALVEMLPARARTSPSCLTRIRQVLAPCADVEQRRDKPLAGRVALVTGAAGGIGRAIARRLATEGACVMLTDIRDEAAHTAATEIGPEWVARGIAVDICDERSVNEAVERTVLAYGGLDLVVNCAGLANARPLLATTAADFELHHAVLAKGSFLMSKAAARVMIDQALGGDIVYVCSKNSVVAGAENIAYAAAKASQAHQVRLLATELGAHGIKVNGVNPDAVVRDSGIFSEGWGASRAAAYGIAEKDLGAFYAGRTLLRSEVLPEHVANAVFVLCGPDTTRTTGMHIPVDGGLPDAFLR